jgi:F-box interacting protein
LTDIDSNTVRVIEKPGLWTIKYSLNGPVCVCIADYDVSVIDLATLNVVRTSVELNHELFFSLSVGCAVPSRKYKVVCLMNKYDPCKVLTLEDGAKWRQVKSPPTPPLPTNGYNLGSAITVNGVMHFLYEVAIPRVDEDYVLGFDLESEEWKVCIKGPTIISGDKLHEYKCMISLNDALCMVRWSSINQCLIWTLTDSSKGTWVNVYTIPVDPTFGLFRALTVMRDGRKLLFYTCNRDIGSMQLRH